MDAHDYGTPNRTRLIDTIERPAPIRTGLSQLVGWIVIAGMLATLVLSMWIAAINMRDDVRATRRAVERCVR